MTDRSYEIDFCLLGERYPNENNAMADDAEDIFTDLKKMLVITGTFEHSTEDKQVDSSRVLIVSGGSNQLTA